jgi:hypothetical protein
MMDTILVATLAVLASIALGIILGYKLSRQRSGRYIGRIVAIGRIQDKIPSMDGGHANMTAYTISMTNSVRGDLTLRIFKRDNPLWEAFEASGPSDHWIIEVHRAKKVKRKTIAFSQLSEGVFHDGKTPAGTWD